MSYLICPAKVQVMMCNHIRHVAELLSDALLPFKWDWGITKIEI